MRISEMLNAMAAWLESPNNEALLLSESDNECMEVVAHSCVLAAALLKNAAQEVDTLEPAEPSKITPEAVEDLATLASAFDASGDENLKKQASVIDELLLTIAAPPNAVSERKLAQDYRLEALRKKYQEPTKELHETNKIGESEKVLEKSPMMKEYKILEAPLSARSCPDHHGAQLARVGEHIWQCEMDKKIYNYDTGFQMLNGDKVPGGDVSQQTQALGVPTHAVFDTREGRLNFNS